MPDIENYSQSDFEKAKQQTEEGIEFWYARDLKDILEYEQWRNFLQVVEKAKESCKNAKNDIEDHFADVSKMVEIGSEAKRNIDDIMLSRYACYLEKNQKILDHMGSTKSAMNLRYVDEHEKSNELVRTKTNSGGVSSYQVRCVRYYFFSYQLAANLFRATQTDDKLRRENIRGKENANNTHFVVGKKVRQTIKELGGTMPEDLELPEKSIQEIEEKPKKRLLQGELE
jgi:DNA-damage-inducible protein D